MGTSPARGSCGSEGAGAEHAQQEREAFAERVIVLDEGRANRELHGPFDDDTVVAASYVSGEELAPA